MRAEEEVVVQIYVHFAGAMHTCLADAARQGDAWPSGGACAEEMTGGGGCAEKVSERISCIRRERELAAQKKSRAS